MKTTFGAINESNVDNIAEHYLGKYKSYVEVYESHCTKAKAGIAVTAADVAGFGKSLDIWEGYVDFCESNGTMGELGPMPNIALDVIAAVQTKNVLPLISSNQPIDEMQGTVYAKVLRAVKGTGGAGSTGGMGGVTPGEVLNDVRNGDRVHDPLFGAGRIQYTNTSPFANTVSGTDTYTVNIGRHLLPGTLKLKVDVAPMGSCVFMDDGDGNILGNQSKGGSVNYDTGEVTIVFAQEPTAVAPIVGTLDVNVEAEPDMVTIGTGYEGIPIHAEFFGLKSESGLLQNFSFSKRWGKSGEDEQANDLADELTNTINAAGIQRLVMADSTPTPAVFNRTAPTGVSVAEHKLSFVNTFATAEKNLAVRAGRGTINRIIAGMSGAATLRAMPDFEPVAGASMQQVGLYGYLGGIPVIRGTDAIVNAGATGTTDQLFGIYMGSGAFDAPLVAAPYLPIFVTSTMPVTDNPLRSQRAIGTMMGLKSVMDRYVTKINLTD
ncbi:major capsid protein [Vibrio phage 150E35-1]|nr:major capsid protein [Vibrio phage 150E35-1]